MAPNMHLAVPVGEQDAPVARRELIVLVLLQVVVVLEPFVLLLADVDLDLPALAAVHRLHLVGVVRRHLVVIRLVLLELLDVLGVAARVLRVEIVLDQQIARVGVADARRLVRLDHLAVALLLPRDRRRPIDPRLYPGVLPL